jgi:hypothetical protein
MGRKKAPLRPEMSLQLLPPEILMKIFGFLPKYEKNKISLISKGFHEVICAIEIFKYPLVIKTETVS